MDDYAYINARIRAMQGQLFDRARYEALLAQHTIADLLKSLMESPYAQALEMTRSRFTAPTSPPTANGQPPAQNGSLLDEAFRRNLAGSLSKVRALASDRPRELIETLLLRWDAYNLKTILRGKRAAVPMEEILASTFPVGVLDEIALAELARAASLRTVAETLATWRAPLARPLREGLRSLGEGNTLQPLEFELDRWAFTEAFRVVADGDDNDRVVRDYLRLLVDKTNLLIGLRYLEERSALSGVPIAHMAMGREAGRHFLDAEGRFTRAQFDALAGARNLAHGLGLLADTAYGWLARIVAAGEPISLPLVERRLDRALVREAAGLSRDDPLGIGVPVAYLEQKTNEVRNLRMIIRGKALGMAAEQIEEWLII